MSNETMDLIRQLMQQVPAEEWRNVMAQHVLPAFSKEFEQLNIRLNKVEAKLQDVADRPVKKVETINKPGAKLDLWSEVAIKAVLLDAYEKNSLKPIEAILKAAGLIKPKCSFMYGNHTSKFFDNIEHMFTWTTERDPGDVEINWVEMITIGDDHWDAPLGSTKNPTGHKNSMLKFIQQHRKKESK